MQQDIKALEAMAQRGLDALRVNDLETARRELGTVLQSGRATVPVAVMLAMACQRLNDGKGLRAALDYALEREPGNIQALLMRGDLLVFEGEQARALQCYDYAIRSVQPGTRLPPELENMLVRARDFRDQIMSSMESHFAASLRSAGYDEQAASPRFRQSVELLAGRKQIYLQQPRAFYYPELPNIQFYPREMFPWLERLEAATDAIEAELRTVMAEDAAAFQPYLQPEKDVPTDTAKLARHVGWKAFFLWKSGKPVAENVARCPRTMEALSGLPLTAIPNRTPNILFSLLMPGQRIEPHNGFLNCRLIGHLPLLAPPGCGLRVGNETRYWERGKAWLFDDSIEHEAFNTSNEVRVILLFEIWRPELTAEERRLIAALLESADSYGGTRRAWED
jgi:aspartyl/asparaginyl beta-hydroxylase (cupin superfamily)